MVSGAIRDVTLYCIIKSAAFFSGVKVSDEVVPFREFLQRLGPENQVDGETWQQTLEI